MTTGSVTVRPPSGPSGVLTSTSVSVSSGPLSPGPGPSPVSRPGGHLTSCGPVSSGRRGAGPTRHGRGPRTLGPCRRDDRSAGNPTLSPSRPTGSCHGSTSRPPPVSQVRSPVTDSDPRPVSGPGRDLVTDVLPFIILSYRPCSFPVPLPLGSRHSSYLYCKA